MLKLAIALCLLILVCGQVVLWRRRDNVLGYLQGAVFVTAFLLPLFGTTLIEDFGDVAPLYALVLSVGSAGFLLGLAGGAWVGNRPARLKRLTFVEPLDGEKRLARVASRTRLVALAGVASLGAAYAVLGYIPLFAADRLSAKYGVGPYAEGFARGRILYNFALAVAGVVLPVTLAVLLHKRKLVDICLAGGLLFGLGLSLSRTLAFSGVLIFAVAVAFERRTKPSLILAGAVAAFLAAAVVNELLLPAGSGRQAGLAGRVAESSPDVRDHLLFLRGFQAEPRFRGWSIFGGLGVGRDDGDPTIYALQVVTGADDVRQFPSGGIRLPVPVWGYASFGLAGAAMWSAISGFFTGWGVTRIRNLLSRVIDSPGAALNVVLAAVFYSGTFEVAATFYFATTAMFVQFAIAAYLGHRLPGLARYLPFEPRTAASGAGGAPETEASGAGPDPGTGGEAAVSAPAKDPPD